MNVNNTMRGAIVRLVPGRVTVRHMLARRGELGVAAYLLTTGFSLAFVFDLTPGKTAGHAWMLALAREQVWIGLFASFGLVALFGATLTAGAVRTSCNVMTLGWLLFLLLASAAHRALPLVSCAQVGFVLVSLLTFLGNGDQ